MAYQSRVSEACNEIEQAQLAVQSATKAYNRGGSLDAVNRANRRLADAHEAQYAVAAGLVQDDR